MSKLANPQHEAWFQSMGKALQVAEREDESAKLEYQQLAKNYAGQFRLAMSSDNSKQIAGLIRIADGHFKREKFVEAKLTLELAASKAAAVLRSANSGENEQREGEGSEQNAGDQGAKQFATKSKGAHYKDEEKKFGWRKDADPSGPIPRESKFFTTRYENTEEERKKSARHVYEDGRMVQREYADANEGREEESGSEQKYTEHEIPDASQGYVIDPKTGLMHTFDSSGIEYHFADGAKIVVPPGSQTEVERIVAQLTRQHGPTVRMQSRHHTTPLAGADVAGAGEVKFKESRISEINDASGHSKPGEEHTLQTMQHLDKQGALTDNRTPREAMQERLERMEIDYQIASDADKPAVLAAKEKLQQELDDLPEDDELADTPMRRDAKVKLIGKVGVSDDECMKAGGDVDAIFNIVAAKAKKVVLVDLALDPVLSQAVRDVIAACPTNPGAMNHLLGDLFGKSLAKSQYLQTEGNELQARKKGFAGAELERKQRPKFEGNQQQHEQWLAAEIEKLGGKEKVRVFGHDPATLQLQTIYDMLTGAINTTTPEERHKAQLAKEARLKAERESKASESEQK